MVLLNVDFKAALKCPSLVTTVGSICRIVEVKANRHLLLLWHSGFLEVFLTIRLLVKASGVK